MGDLEFQERRCNLKYQITLSDTEELETYHRKDKIRITGIEEQSGQEFAECTMKTVVEIARAVGANVTAEDISIAHRQPSRGQGPRPISVRFNRCSVKFNLLRQNEKLAESENLKAIRIMEDLSATRMKFLGLMRSDDRHENIYYDRQGTIFYSIKDLQRSYKTTSIYESGIFLKYSFGAVEQCFNKYHQMQPETVLIDVNVDNLNEISSYTTSQCFSTIYVLHVNVQSLKKTQLN